MPPRKQDKTKSKLNQLKADKLRELCEKEQVESSGTRDAMIEPLMACSMSQSTALCSMGESTASCSMGESTASCSRGASTAACSISESTALSSNGKEVEDVCVVIVYTTTEIATEPIMIEGAQQALEDVVEHEELLVKYDPLHVGNQRGLSLIDLPREMAIVKAELASAKDREAGQDERIFAQEKRILSLETRVGDLTASLDAYKKIRHRFLDTYAETKSASTSAHARKHIREGNEAAHGGDAKTDADLYRFGKQREDFSMFEELYGYLPQVVWSFTHMESVNVLNLHAGIKADQREQINPRFYEHFANFIDAWKKSDFSSSYLGQGMKNAKEAAVCKAYWAFHECLHIEEQRKKEEAHKRAAGKERA